MKTLDELRRDIDAADRDLLDAFARRIAAVKHIGEVKKAAGKPVYDPEREAYKISRLEQMSDPEVRPFIRELYEKVMGIAKDIEEKSLFGVLGQKIPHTYSPQIHTLITTDYTYTVIEREEDELTTLCEQGKAGVYGGFNVTIPYKKNAFAMCDELTDSAKKIGAVNTVVFREDGSSLGANTDVYGFEYMLKSSGIDPFGKKVLVLGTGGASLAVNYALDELNAGEIKSVSRSGEINYTNVYELCADAQIIVNCTPVGMFPNVEESPIDISKFTKLEAVADIVYNPSMTRLLYDAKNAGIKTAGGLKMLVAQAFKASAFFLGAKDDSEAEAKIDVAAMERVTDILETRMKNITLIGMPGSGKTRFAEALGLHLGREVVDLDSKYTEEFGETPAQTIKESGEDIFRKNESKVALKYLTRSGIIISCGGGIVTRKENYFPLKCNSTVIYNERPLEVLCLSGRPLSAANGTQKLYEDRKEAYESLADIIINVGAKDSPDQYIEEALRKYDENTCS